MGWAFSTTFLPLYPREKSGTHFTGSWVCPRDGLDGCRKFRPIGFRSPDCPTRSDSLYLLSYSSRRRIKQKAHIRLSRNTAFCECMQASYRTESKTRTVVPCSQGLPEGYQKVNGRYTAAVCLLTTYQHYGECTAERNVFNVVKKASSVEHK